MPETLLDIQTQLLKIFTDPKGPRKLSEESADFCGFVEGQKGATTVQRVSVYSDAYFLRIKEVLESDFELTQKYLGGAQFYNLVVAYLQAHHPSSPYAQNLGSCLLNFVYQQSPWNKDIVLGNIVRMEWLIAEVVYEAFLENLAVEKLSVLSAEEFAEATFVVDGAHRILRTEELIEDLWMERGSDSIDLKSIPQDLEKPWLLIRREREGKMNFFRFSEGEALLWKHLDKGQKLSEICEVLGDHEELVAPAMTQLGSWIQAGLIIDIKQDFYPKGRK